MQLKIITNVKRWVGRRFNKRKLRKLENERLVERINEFLKRIKVAIPDFIAMSGNLIEYKKWLARPFLYLNYIPYIELSNKDQRGFFTLSNKLMKPKEEYEEMIKKIKNGEVIEPRK